MDIFYTEQWAKFFVKPGEDVGTFNFGDADKFIRYSFIKRPIGLLPFVNQINDIGFDIVSPYGYGGIYLSPKARSDQKFIAEYKNEFTNYCRKNSIVSEFIRFHPFDKNQDFFQDYYDLIKVNDNIFVDLNQTEAEISKSIDKRHRYSIRRAKDFGVEIEIDQNFCYLDDFINLYQQTMSRNSASDFYFFPESFFKNLLAEFGHQLLLLVAKLNGKVIAASFFVINNENIYYFLSGSDYKFFHVFANHLLLWEAIAYAKKNNKKYLNLGGGMKTDDSLFLFKSGFSKYSVPYFVGKKIHDQSKYDFLLTESGVDRKIDFFPQYRYNLKVN
ncbi:MAG: peptidoglycan bridge formation glycyltransferase FemA/FemB family protein [Candidatus Buchananbacteria bacterium]